jgi:hypothetical protein
MEVARELLSEETAIVEYIKIKRIRKLRRMSDDGEADLLSLKLKSWGNVSADSVVALPHDTN